MSVSAFVCASMLVHCAFDLYMIQVMAHTQTHIHTTSALVCFVLLLVVTQLTRTTHPDTFFYLLPVLQTMGIHVDVFSFCLILLNFAVSRKRKPSFQCCVNNRASVPHLVKLTTPYLKLYHPTQ